MRILYLGLPCRKIEMCLMNLGHEIYRIDSAIDISFFDANHFDFGLSYRYTHIIPLEIIDIFGGRLVNMHISLLPWNKGADPNLWSFLENTPAGVSIHKINEKIDAGDIILQHELYFDVYAETLRSSYNKLSYCIESLFIDNAKDILANSIESKPQFFNGTYHRKKDKMPYMYLIEKKGWDTPVLEVVGKAAEISYSYRNW